MFLKWSSINCICFRIGRLQEYIRQQDASKNDLIASIARKSDADREKLTEETKRLNARIQSVSTDIIKNMSEREDKIRDELLQKYNNIQSV